MFVVVDSNNNVSKELRLHFPNNSVDIRSWLDLVSRFNFVIMSEKQWINIGNLFFPDRGNIILTSENILDSNVIAVADLESAEEIIRSQFSGANSFILGDSELLNTGLGGSNFIFLTKCNFSGFEGDSFNVPESFHEIYYTEDINEGGSTHSHHIYQVEGGEDTKYLQDIIERSEYEWIKV